LFFLYAQVKPKKSHAPFPGSERTETLLLDSMRGDATLFTRRSEVEAEWRSHYAG
jgi:glucose-6-phosphate 1-dehydrogenase